MSALDIETGLLCTLIYGWQTDPSVFSRALIAGLEPELFVGPRKPAFDFLLTHYRKHAEVAPASVMLAKFPDLELPDETNRTAKVEYYVDELKKRRLHNRLTEGLKEAAEQLKKKDPQAALDLLRKAVSSSHQDTSSAYDVNLKSSGEERRRRYEERRERRGLLGLPTPWPTLDRLTQGWQNEQLITVAARLGVGKSWLLMLLANAMHSHGFRPLVVTREMATVSLDQRIDAIRAHVPHSRLRAGQLDAEQERQFFDSLEVWNEQEDFILSSDLATRRVTGLAAKIEQYGPDVLLVDGAYLMQSETGKDGWEALTEITRELKALGQSAKIPVIITHQINRDGSKKGATTANLAYSDSVGQDSDVVLLLYQDSDMELNDTMQVELLKQRDGTTGKLLSNWNLDTMDFSEVQEHDDFDDDSTTGGPGGDDTIPF